MTVLSVVEKFPQSHGTAVGLPPGCHDTAMILPLNCHRYSMRLETAAMVFEIV